MKKAVLIDGNAIVHRAYHALPPFKTKTGRLVNAVYGFFSVFLKIWSELEPDYFFCTFDLGGPTFRDLEYKEYKAKRQKADQSLYDQMPLIKEILSDFSILIFI